MSNMWQETDDEIFALRKRIAELEAEADKYVKEVQVEHEMRKAQILRAEQAEAENKRLKEALEFYALPDIDNGKRARKALKKE